MAAAIKNNWKLEKLAGPWNVCAEMFPIKFLKLHSLKASDALLRSRLWERKTELFFSRGNGKTLTIQAGVERTKEYIISEVNGNDGQLEPNPAIT